MFRESDKNPQFDAFSSPATLLQGSSLNHYLKKGSWHNTFREQVVMRVNEDIFKGLYCSDNGSPNASIRVLAGMMILKEGQGWSDEQLFEQCQYNLLVRSALGLMNLTDTLPAASTYYLFRKRIAQYNRENDVDLFKQCMQYITREQILEFNVSGKQIRMDSKLIGSNISWYSRYELVHETLRMFIKEREEHIYKRSLSQAEFSLIAQIMEEEGEKVVYRSTKKEIDDRFQALGKLMYRLIKLFKKYDYGAYRTLKSVFEQQFTLTPEKTILPREKEEISAQSIQSPHDPDCHYRNKGGNKVKGYSVNLTETCNTAENEDSSSKEKDTQEDETNPVLNLITDINLDVVSTPDSDFLEPSIEESQSILEDKIEKVYADGAYNSADTQAYAESNDVELILTGLQGKTPRYELSLNEENDDELIVLDTLTGQFITAYLIATPKTNSDTENKEKKWRIITEEGKYRYFTLENVRTSMLRQKLRDVPIEERWKRNNVEASIFQLGVHCTDGKTRYRGLAANRLWAYARATWINFRRILKYMMQTSKRTLLSEKELNLFHKIGINIKNNINTLKNKFLIISQPNYLNFSKV
ncbi:MAG: transposase [Lutispora sp.]|jgi:hypothetical protein